jgi:hypothetical protein
MPAPEIKDPEAALKRVIALLEEVEANGWEDVSTERIWNAINDYKGD